MVMHLTISFDTLINTLIHNQSSGKIVGPYRQNFFRSVVVCSVISHIIALTFLLTLVEMNVLGAFPFRMIAFYSHLFGHRAGVAVFLALNLLKIDQSKTRIACGSHAC
jgi:hypothetical protein